MNLSSSPFTFLAVEMRFLAFSLLLGTLSFAASNEVFTAKHHSTMAVVKSALPEHFIEDAMIPNEFTWCKHAGRCTPILNQHDPMKNCLSSWAFAASSSLADRVFFVQANIRKREKMTRAETQETRVVAQEMEEEVMWMPAIQVLLNCGSDVAGSCHGGTASGAYQYIFENGIPPATCLNYTAEVNSCSPVHICQKRLDNETVVEDPNYEKIFLQEYGSVQGEKNIQKEILVRGPVACAVDDAKLRSYVDGITPVKAGFGANFFVSLVGWGGGGENKYWIARQSWGTQYGEMGFVRIVRRRAFDPVCYWAVPKLT